MRHQRNEGPPWGRPGTVPGWRPPRARRGDIRTALLVVLTDGPGHGYDLIQRLDERSGGRWRPSPGSVYPTLQLLEEEGLLTSKETDGKRVYTLTDAGREQAEVAPRRGRPPWADGPGGPDGAPAGDLRDAVGQLIAAARQVADIATPAQVTQAEEIVNDARRRLYAILAEA